jgi:hypothetical protein
LGRRTTVLSGLLILPSLAFVVANVLKYELGFPGPYDTLAGLGELVPGLEPILLSPIVIGGGPLLAAIITALFQIRIWGDSDKSKSISIFGVEFSLDAASMLILLVSCPASVFYQVIFWSRILDTSFRT